MPLGCDCGKEECKTLEAFKQFIADRGIELLNCQAVGRETWDNVRHAMTDDSKKFLGFIQEGFQLYVRMHSGVVITIGPPPEQQPPGRDEFKI